MKHQTLFWGIMCLAYILTFSFLLDITPEEHRYIKQAESMIGANYWQQLTSGSYGYYTLLEIMTPLVGNTDMIIRLLRFAFLAIFFTSAFLYLKEKDKLDYLIIFMLFPSFIELIFSQSKNIFAFGLFALFLINKNKSSWWLWATVAIIGSLLYATFYGLQILILIGFYSFLRDESLQNSWKSANLAMLAFFVILNIAYWGWLGFNPFVAGVHEEVGLVGTVLMLAILCAFDFTLFGTLSLAMSIMLFIGGEPYWAYRPLELMAINAVLNGKPEIAFKSLASLFKAWPNPNRLKT